MTISDMTPEQLREVRDEANAALEAIEDRRKAQGDPRAVEVSIRAYGSEEALKIAFELKSRYGVTANIVLIALDPCPQGYDHSHLRYDGDRFCPGCKGKL